MPISDQQLDDRLRQVSAPDRFFDVLHGIPADVEIEASLTDVSLPDQLLDRLHRTAGESVFESLLESQLPQAPNTVEAVARLHNIPFDRSPTRRMAWSWVTGAAAAAVAVAVQLGAFWSVVRVARQSEPKPKLLMVDTGPLQLTANPEPPPLVITPTLEVAMESAEDDWGPKISPPTNISDKPWSAIAALVAAGANLDEDLIVAHWGVLGAPTDPEATTPELEFVTIEAPKGVEPPRLRGVYDRGFLLREKESPPLSPAAHAELAVSRPPLTTRTDSVDLLRRLAKRERLPEDDEVRVEDFIAAQNYYYPVRPGAVRMHAYGGPSAFSANQAWMLQLGAAVGRLAQQPPPTHWTLAIDLSSGMAWRNRLAEVRRTIDRLIHEMRDEDRLSIVVFREEAWLTASFVTREQAGDVLDVVDGWEPRGRCDFVAGVRQGLSAAVDGGFNGQRRLVVLSDGRASWPERVAEQVLDLYQKSREWDVIWHWLELAGPEEADPEMARRLRSSGALAQQLADQQYAIWPLLEEWYGRSLMRAADVELHLQFEPKSVRFHRLVGHRASAWAGIQPLEHRIDLRAGEEATVLFELWLRPSATSQIAIATLSWRDPRTGEPRSAKQRITRADFASSFQDAAPALQHATIAAEAGEVLSRSYFAPNRSRTLREVVQACGKVSSELQQREDFRRFAEWLRDLERIRQRRGD